MVQRSRAEIIIWGIVFRFFVLIGVLILSFFTASPAWEFNNVFGFKNPSGFFGYSVADWELAWMLTVIFWSGIIFGTLGKKTDYVFITGLLFFVLWDYYYSQTTPLNMYFGLIGVLISANTIGYLLKQARMKWFSSHQ